MLISITSTTSSTKYFYVGIGCVSGYLNGVAVYYSFVATNKSGALHSVIGQLSDPALRGSMYGGGTIDGLMKLMSENNNCSIGVFDELYTFLDNIDRGVTGNVERGKIGPKIAHGE